MKLNELMKTVSSSTENDWNRIDPNGPFFIHSIQMNGETAETCQHFEYASYKNDLQITMGWDLIDNPDFKAIYANCNPDPNAKGMWLDLFFNGALVFRTKYISVDGGRCNLPIPNNENGILEVSHKYSEMINLLNHLQGIDTGTIERYYKVSSIVVVEKDWDF